MPIIYKIDVLQALKDAGYSTYKLRKDKVFAESTLQAFRDGVLVSYSTISKLCDMLRYDVGDILQNVSADNSHPVENGGAIK